MCYSAAIKVDLKRLGRLFRSRAEYDAFRWLYLQRLKNPALKTPVGLDRYFVFSQDPEEARIAAPILQFFEDEKARTRTDIASTKNEIRELAGLSNAASRKKIETRERRLEKLARKLDFSFDRISPLDDRIFPGYFAPVVVRRGHENLLVPMRYRVRRPDGGEIPSQYNVFNARKDSLLNAATWRPLFGRNHAIFPFTKFFEWVERDGKKREISFSPSERTIMWAASLYSAPAGVPASENYLSFAMVTDDPPPEVAEAGHDRCPIFLAETELDAWLDPQKKTADFLLSLLGHKEKPFYLHNLVA